MWGSISFEETIPSIYLQVYKSVHQLVKLRLDNKKETKATHY